MIDRRVFLRRLGFGTVAAAAAATSAYDVERLLWVPGERLILLPPEQAIVLTPSLHTHISVEWNAWPKSLDDLEFDWHRVQHGQRLYGLIES